MANFYLLATFGLCLLKFCLTETQFNITCRYGGVFHVEKNGRYSLTRAEAIELCRALNSTLATLEQFERAHALGFETCRYGFIVGHIVIPRINPYHLCAANHTGIYKLSANTTGRYDAYCYNATETRSKACEPIERIDITFLSNQSEIVIDNEDGSRYNADGTRHSGDSSTSGVDDENLGSGSIHDTTPGDASIRRSSPSYYGSVTPYSHMPDHSSGGGEKDFPVKHYDDEISPTSTDILATAADFPREDDVQHPASTRSTSNIDSDQGPHKGDGEPTSSPGLSTTTTVTSQPGTAHVPEWLIIVAALLALALILAVCIAVNSRRRCGQKKKLVINNGKGAVEDRKTRELNGDASKSQEMVHLVHKEQSNDRTGACDEFLTVDETQNHQDGDMKSGV
ncbi:CD44 antigen precursor [Gallus gallus]|uniref:CD44 antigen precursor n=1 Tax=Gallus gallus TaxID=9031 RepID=UPI00003ADD0E|nr:CD44 antigen precursor [Gallus gallus]XP_040556579.1 CD44 antigen isoform X47 [Gallus gallus]|eukprot:NP_990191.2 CD44 antigen precursor [Gallus gallus]